MAPVFDPFRLASVSLDVLAAGDVLGQVPLQRDNAPD